MCGMIVSPLVDYIVNSMYGQLPQLMFEICVKVTVMLGTSVRVEPTAGPPHPPPPT